MKASERVVKALMERGLTEESLLHMSNTDLQTLRDEFNGDKEMQNYLGPLEHRAFTREVVQEHGPVKGAIGQALLIPSYSVKKVADSLLNAAFSIGTPQRSDPSLEEISQAFQGVVDGLGEPRKPTPYQPATKKKSP